MHTHSQSRSVAARTLRASFAAVAFLAASLVGSPSAHAVVGRDWTARNPGLSGLGEDIKAVASTESKTGSAAPVVVAVGKHGLIITSADNGATWTKRTSGIGTDLNDVIFVTTVGSTPFFLAVGNNSTALTSPDGVTWTAKNTPHLSTAAQENLFAACAAGSQVIVVGGSTTAGVVFGWDGTVADWTKGVVASPEPLIGVIAPGTKLYAIASKSVFEGTLAGSKATFAKKAPTSGVVLTADSPASICLAKIGASTNMVLCTRTIAGGRCKIWFSNDGAAWSDRTPAALPVGNTTMNLRFTGPAAALRVVATGPGGSCWVSNDSNVSTATAWTQLDTGSPQALFGGALTSLSTAIAVGEGGRIYNRAVADTSWTSRGTTGSTGTIRGVASDGTAFIGVGNGFCLTSPTGTAWTEQTQTGKSMRSIARTASQYVIVGSGTWTTTDGMSLTETRAASSTEVFNRVLFAGGQCIAVGFDSTAGANKSLIMLSANGSNWAAPTTVSVNAKTALNGIAATASGGLLVAVGDGGNVVSSTDFGTNWGQRKVTLTAGENFTDVGFFNNLFMAVTSKGGIWTSPDGITWKSRRASSAWAFNRIIAAGNQAIAFGDAGHSTWTFASTVWTDQVVEDPLTHVGTSQNLFDAAFNGTTLAAVGAVGIVMTSDSGQPSRPTLGFASASTTVLEDAGVVNVSLNLAPAATVPLTVLFTVGGTATSGADFTVVTTPVSFAAGDTTKNIAVTIKKDAVDEIAETITLSLGAPTGDAILGANKIHTITITDLFPTFTVHPADQLVVAGSNVALSATVTEAPNLTGTWKKNGVAFTGANVSPNSTGTYPTPMVFNLNITGVTTAQAGAITLTAVTSSGGGSKTSNTAQLGVVENPAGQVLAVRADSTVILTAKAAGNGLSYQWLLNGQPIHNSTDLRIIGTNSNKLTIKNSDGGDSGTYACRVTQTTVNGQLTQNAATTVVAVQTSVPLVTTSSLPSATVALPYDFTPTASEVATAWSISGLPPGLTADPKTGRITGKATATGTFTVTLIATDVWGNSPPVILPMTVNAIPGFSGDTYHALIDRDATLNQKLGGYLRISVAANGSLTGSTTSSLAQGSVSNTIVGSITYVPGAPDTLVADIPLTPAAQPAGFPQLPAIHVQFTITPSTKGFAGTITSGASSLPFTGTAESQWSSTPVTADKQRYCNFVIKPGAITNSIGAADKSHPLGWGFGSFTVPANGKINMAGHTADGNAYTLSTVMKADGKIPFYVGVPDNSPTRGANSDPFVNTVFVGPMGTIASLHGLIDLQVHPSLTFVDTDNGNATKKEVLAVGDITWLRIPEPVALGTTATTKERFYRNGFTDGNGNPNPTNDPLTYTVDGGMFVKQPSFTSTAPTSTGIIMNVPNNAGNARIRFYFGGLPDQTIRNNASATDHNDPDALLRLLSDDTVPNTDNTNTVSPIFNGTTGRFRGTFSIADAGVNRSNIAYHGVFIRQLNATNSAIQVRGYGYFLLQQLAEPAAGPNETDTNPATNSSIRSGRVRIGTSGEVP